MKILNKRIEEIKLLIIEEWKDEEIKKDWEGDFRGFLYEEVDALFIYDCDIKELFNYAFDNDDIDNVLSGGECFNSALLNWFIDDLICELEE